MRTYQKAQALIQTVWDDGAEDLQIVFDALEDGLYLNTIGMDDQDVVEEAYEIIRQKIRKSHF